MFQKIFLLSPADVSGVRARQLCSPRATFPIARLFQSADGLPIGEAFSFMSGLYFRGKIAYARRFSAPPVMGEDSSIYVIAPGFGLVPPEWVIDIGRMKRLRRVPVDLTSKAYRKPLEEHAATLAARLPETDVVLLGSIATGKYVNLLGPIFGDRLLFPQSFMGLGDMSRGALMLAAARSGVELEYITFNHPSFSSARARSSRRVRRDRC